MKLKDTLLLVGSCADTRNELRGIFSDSYNIIEAATNEQGLFLFQQNVNCIAAAILDIRLPKRREESLTVKLRSTPDGESIPVIILCEQADVLQEIKGYEYGASDVIFKPFNEAAIFHRVQTLVELSIHRNNLEILIEEQSNILRASNETMVDVLSTIIEYRSVETGNHVMRIRQYTRVLLEKIMETYPEYNLTPEDINSIVSASSLHDIGKISIPDSILNKPGKLTKEEFEIMKTHTTNGAQILQNLNEVGDRKYLRYAYNICLYHHERWDGNGYPMGLVGDDIPICAQVAGIADVYDALTTDRVYKKAFPHTRAINMILNGECGAFSNKVLECLKKVRDEFQNIHLSLEDSPEGTDLSDEDLTSPLPAPSYQLRKVDALQTVQVKYQTLLHYTNVTVVEADLRSGVYHIVFNPNPDFYLSTSKSSIHEAIQDMIHTVVHSDDRAGAAEQFSECTNMLFGHGMRKYTFTFRMYIPSSKTYVRCRVTVMHIRDNVPGTMPVMFIFEPEAEEKSSTPAVRPEALHQTDSISEYFYDLMGSTLVMDNSRDFRILQGAENLFKLLGYTPKEIEAQFQNSLMEMVPPEDRGSLLLQINEQLQSGKILELEYRMVAKDGSLIWVLDKSRLVEDENGREYLFTVLVNNSKSKKIQEQLQEELARNQLITLQSSDVVFELDMTTDTLWCSDKWEERFGHRALRENYTSTLFTQSHIHPDDMMPLQNCIIRLLSGENHVIQDVRIINADGVYTWNQIRATVQKDSYGKVHKIIGVIVDIDDEKQSLRSLQIKSERDALTGLYNKESTRQRITSLLENHPDSQRSALLMMDLDNFKGANDTYGHLFGDNLLIKTASMIRKYFRSDDIIGRIGGDEFAVYVNSFTDTELIHSRCRLLQEMLNDMFREMAPEIAVSCSIGIALVPDHGTSYVELYSKADQALYQAKNAGKNRYVIYDSNLTVASQNLLSAINETIDSNEQPGIANNSLLYYLFQRLYESTDMQQTIQNILAETGRRMNVSRVYIFETNEEHTELSNTFEWCNQGISPEIDNLQGLNYIDGEVAGWPDVFNERGIFYCTDISSLESRFRQVLEPQGIRSLLQCSFYDNGTFSGFVGFDECTLNRSWTQEQIDLLSLLSQTVAIFLLKERSRQKTERMSANLQNVLNNQDAWVYVIDPNTFQLKYINQRTKNLAGDIPQGSLCYKVLQNQDTPCRNCPVLTLNDRHNAEAIIENKSFNLTVRCRATDVEWDGSPACLITCHKLQE